LKETVKGENFLADSREVSIAILETLQFNRPGILYGHDYSQDMEMRNDDFKKDLINRALLVVKEDMSPDYNENYR